jgi:thiosulfate/3-mercaptopyruvate sulfurtransferase
MACGDDARMTTAPLWPPIIDAHELVDLVREKRNLLVVDCRYDLSNKSYGESAYGAGHIPGAVFASMDADLAAPKRADTGRHPLPSPQDFAATLARWGFTPTSQVIAYDQGAGALAARLWWMLRAIGHPLVQVLDGGMPAWLAADGELETTTPSITPTKVEPREFTGFASTADVATALAASRITLFDARGADRFAGRNETIDPVAGHVPGALNMPFTANLGADQRFLPVSQLRERWAPVAAHAGNAPLVSMCGSGVTACHNLLALELAGFPAAQLYVGSFSEWITDPARTVATGE